MNRKRNNGQTYPLSSLSLILLHFQTLAIFSPLSHSDPFIIILDGPFIEPGLSYFRPLSPELFLTFIVFILCQ